MIPYIFLALFFIASVIHLIDSWRDLPKRRRITKPMLLFFLMLYYVFSADKISRVDVDDTTPLEPQVIREIRILGN